MVMLDLAIFRGPTTVMQERMIYLKVKSMVKMNHMKLKNIFLTLNIKIGSTPLE